jgi:hypothetical protein
MTRPTSQRRDTHASGPCGKIHHQHEDARTPRSTDAKPKYPRTRKNAPKPTPLRCRAETSAHPDPATKSITNTKTHDRNKASTPSRNTRGRKATRQHRHALQRPFRAIFSPHRWNRKKHEQQENRSRAPDADRNQPSPPQADRGAPTKPKGNYRWYVSLHR